MATVDTVTPGSSKRKGKAHKVSGWTSMALEWTGKRLAFMASLRIQEIQVSLEVAIVSSTDTFFFFENVGFTGKQTGLFSWKPSIFTIAHIVQ